MYRIQQSGWFHGPRLSNPKALSQAAFSSCPTASLETWINPTYLSGAPQIQNAFMDQSYIILKDFLEPGMYTALVQEQEQWEWTRVGAANVKSHESLSRSSPLMSQLISLFGSESFARFLESLTGMESLQSKSLHAQQFQKGHYTLLHDHNLEETGLDFLFSFSSVPTEEWDESWGGALHYLADKETLLSRFPSQNELMLVYRDEGVLRFLKYVNSQCPSRRRDIWGLVVESEEGGESLNETDADTMMR